MPRDERPGKKPYGSRGRRPRGSLRRIPRVVETNGEPAMKKRAFLYLSSGAQNQPGLKQARPWCHARRGKANTPNSGFLPGTIFEGVRHRFSETGGRSPTLLGEPLGTARTTLKNAVRLRVDDTIAVKGRHPES